MTSWISTVKSVFFAKGNINRVIRKKPTQKNSKKFSSRFQNQSKKFEFYFITRIFGKMLFFKDRNTLQTPCFTENRTSKLNTPEITEIYLFIKRWFFWPFLTIFPKNARISHLFSLWDYDAKLYKHQIPT